MKNKIQTYLVGGLLISCGLVKSQSGAKWATGGNATSAGDFFGTTNAQPILFKTNSVNHAQFNTNGKLQIFGLAGTGNRLLQTDANGNLLPFNMGLSTQVLFGNGTWGNLPTYNSYWIASGNNIFFNTGKVGIGTNNPQVALDVNGDLRVSNNVYVGGGILISDKVNATSEVKTIAMRADSILMDSTKAIVGTTRIVGDAKLAQKLSVTGSATFSNDLNVNGTFRIGGLGFVTVPPSNGAPTLIGYGTNLIPAIPVGFCPPTYGQVMHQFTGAIQMHDRNLTLGLENYVTVGFNGTDSYIDLSQIATGTGQVPQSKLLINPSCGADVAICPGQSSGFVSVGHNLEIGAVTRNTNMAFNVAGSTNQTGQNIVTNHTGDYGFNTRLQVNRNGTKALSVVNTANAAHESFTINGDGSTIINIQNSTTTTEAFTIFDAINNRPNFLVKSNGNVYMRRLEISTNPFPDYVFEKDYKLLPLSELKVFIEKNKKLPEYSSATEVHKNGMDVGETTRLNVQSIEQNTLYIIQLKEELDELKKQNSELKTQLSEILKKLEVNKHD